MSSTAHLPPLLRRLHLLKEEMGDASVRVIEQILGDPSAFLNLTIAELSEAAQTSDATVVRLVQAMGFGGYQEFKLQLSRALAVTRTLDLSVETSDDPVQVVRKVVDASATALHDSLDHLHLEHFVAAVQAVSTARHTLLVGAGSSGLVAQDGAYRGERLGLSCVAHTDPGSYLPAASLLEPADVLIAVSFSGSTPDVVRASKLARQAGATVIALTGLGRSALTRTAHHVLTSSAPGDHYRPESLAARLPQIALLDALFTALHVSQEPYLSERLAQAQQARRSINAEALH